MTNISTQQIPRQKVDLLFQTKKVFQTILLVITEVVGERRWHVDLPHQGLAAQGGVPGII